MLLYNRLNYNLNKYLHLDRIGPLERIYFVIIFIGLVLRVWELDGRTMHYDEAIHLYYGWELTKSFDFQHSPWMHGPFQIELVAFFIRFIGDSTFIARLPYVLFGVILITLPYFIRHQIGVLSSIIISILLIFSPILSYFSRFGRNDIIIITLMFILLIIFWKYIETQKNRYLYITSALLALLLATKETSYFVIFFIGIIAFIYGTKDIWYFLVYSVVRKNSTIKLKKSLRNPAIGFFVLVLSIVLPQTAAIISIPLNFIGIDLAMSDNVSGSSGMTGLPQESQNIIKTGYLSSSMDTYIYPLLITISIFGYLTYNKLKHNKFNYGICVIGISIVCILWIVFGNAINLVSNIIPYGQVYNEGIDFNYGIASFTFFVLLIIGSVIGGFWHRHVWLICFIIFYFIWITLYTTLFHNAEGIFTGSWQSLGYWFAQQDVARGNQPWYYYVVGLSTYELLSFVFGFVGIILLIRQGKFFGIILALWALFSFLIYTLASERMPWLMVNIIVPFIICAGIFISHIFTKIDLKEINYKYIFSYALILICIILIFWISWLEGKPREEVGFIPYWLFGLIFMPVLICTVYIIYNNVKYLNNCIIVLIVILFVITTIGMFRLNYIYDDKYKEILVYAQGSYDLKVDYYKYTNGISQLSVDNELWFPLQWYSRNDNRINYEAFCEDCSYNIDNTDIYFVHNTNIFNHPPNIVNTNQIRKNLLWYPESYRRVSLSDTNNSFFKDISFLVTVLFKNETRGKILKYFILREQESDWFRSEYSIYVKN